MIQKDQCLNEAFQELLGLKQKIDFYEEKFFKQLQILKRNTDKFSTMVITENSQNQHYNKVKMELLFHFYTEYFKISRTLSVHYGYEKN